MMRSPPHRILILRTRKGTPTVVRITQPAMDRYIKSQGGAPQVAFAGMKRRIANIINGTTPVTIKDKQTIARLAIIVATTETNEYKRWAFPRIVSQTVNSGTRSDLKKLYQALEGRSHESG